MLSPVDLLRKLSSGIRPEGISKRTPGAPIEHLPFDGLLEQIRRTGVSDVRPVRIDSNIDLELTEDEREVLAVAVDAAEARGSRRLLVVLRGKALNVEVAPREVNNAGDVLEARVLDGFDAVVVAPETLGARELRERLADPDAHARPPLELAALLEGPASNLSVGRLEALARRESA